MNQDSDFVILVDEQDRDIGAADKLAAHRRGQRHRAISVCLVDPAGRMLLQRRARTKYHSGGLWTNACCTHPRPGERVDDAAERRLREELGVECRLQFVSRTHYRAPVGNGLIEDEIVHLFVGGYDGIIDPDPNEVAEVAWRSYPFLAVDIVARPEDYTVWFSHYVRHLGEKLFAGGSPVAYSDV